MNKTQIIGLVLFITSISCYIFQPFKADFFDFLSGVVGAIGLSLILNLFKKKQ
jgi:hypothetical protein